MEYIILVVAVAVLLMTILVEYGATVDAKWRGATENSAWDTVESSLNDGSGPGGEDGAGCPNYYNSATGRWHDSESHLFVPFAEAEAAGC